MADPGGSLGSDKPPAQPDAPRARRYETRFHCWVLTVIWCMVPCKVWHGMMSPVHPNMRSWTNRRSVPSLNSIAVGAAGIMFWNVIFLCQSGSYIGLHRVSSKSFLQFTWVVDDAKCILVTRVCLSVCLSVAACLSLLHGGPGCNVHYWADLQSVHGWRCYGSIARTRNVSKCLYSLYVWFVSVRPTTPVLSWLVCRLPRISKNGTNLPLVWSF